MFEGIPTWPDAGRFWDIVQKFGVDILYTAPTAIRSLMGFGEGPLHGKRLDSLKVLGTVGEPINAEAWHWYDENVGKGKCPIVDTWWQTETGGTMISNMAGITPAVPTYATLPMPGIQPVLVDESGNTIQGSDAAVDGVYHEHSEGVYCAPPMVTMKDAVKLISQLMRIYTSQVMGVFAMNKACIASLAGLMMY
jgi:acetyl-CoA synthetase